MNSSDRSISIISWTSVSMLLGFMCFAHLGVQICFIFRQDISPAVGPVALIVALFIGDFFGRRAGLAGRLRLWPPLITLVLITLSIVISAMFFDLSWDGQWYHQVAVYQMAKGWNPLIEPIRNFSRHNELWVQHYAKGTWIVATALYKTFGHIEWAKVAPWLTFFASIIAVFVTGLDFGLSRLKSAMLSLLVALNPVVTCELMSFQVDGIMILLLGIYVAGLFSIFKNPNWLLVYTGLTTMILCINSKFTGLIYLCFVIAAGGLYILFRRRDWLLRFVLINLAAIVIGTLVFGYNPYVTNFIHRGNPFYPILGSKEYPSLKAQGQDPIENMETPHNMLAKNRFFRLGYAIFGRPSAPPIYPGPDVQLMFPFTATVEDIALYRFVDLRISGFGPWFSGLLLLNLVLLFMLFINPAYPRGLLAIGIVTIITSLLISEHTWWARYGPQLWLLPILPIMIVFHKSTSWFKNIFNWSLAGILLLNAIIVLAVHLNWEIKSTQKLTRQLTELQKLNKTIEVNFNWFEEPISERFNTWDISYRSVRRPLYWNNNAQPLMTVAEGNPGTVYYLIVENSSQ